MQNQARAVRQEKMPCSAEPGKSRLDRTRQVWAELGKSGVDRTRQVWAGQSKASLGWAEPDNLGYTKPGSWVGQKPSTEQF